MAPRPRRVPAAAGQAGPCSSPRGSRRRSRPARSPPPLSSVSSHGSTHGCGVGDGDLEPVRVSVSHASAQSMSPSVPAASGLLVGHAAGRCVLARSGVVGGVGVVVVATAGDGDHRHDDHDHEQDRAVALQRLGPTSLGTPVAALCHVPPSSRSSPGRGPGRTSPVDQSVFSRPPASPARARTAARRVARWEMATAPSGSNHGIGSVGHSPGRNRFPPSTYTICPVPSLPASSGPVASGSHQKPWAASSLELRSLSGHTPSPQESRGLVSPDW